MWGGHLAGKGTNEHEVPPPFVAGFPRVQQLLSCFLGSVFCVVDVELGAALRLLRLHHEFAAAGEEEKSRFLPSLPCRRPASKQAGKKLLGINVARKGELFNLPL